MLFPVEHDAFRSKVGSLNSAYPLLMLLRTDPQNMDTLASWLRVRPRALRERARSLVAAGLAVQSDHGLALTGEPVLPLLDAVAVKAGTAGARKDAIKVYRAKAAAWRLTREEAKEVGSPRWRMIRHARMVAKMAEGDLAALVEHLGGDLDAAATFMVEQAIQINVLHPVPRTSGLAMLAPVWGSVRVDSGRGGGE